MLSGWQLDALRVVRHAVVTQLELRRGLEDFRSVERLLHDDIPGAVNITHSVCRECFRFLEADMPKRK